MRQWIALFLALWMVPAQAGTVSRLYNFEPHTKIQSEQVDAEFDNILGAINGNLDSENIAAAGVATANIATASVTHAKMGPLGHQISNSSGVADRASAVEALIPNMVANITVVSRPVWVGMQPAGGASSPGSISYRHGSGGATGNVAYISFQRDQATQNQSGIVSRNITSPTNNTYISFPCSAFWFLDDPGVGPHNYAAAFRVATGDDGFLRVDNCKLVVFEL